MRTAADYGEISGLVFAHMKPGVLTNNFLTAGEYRAEIAAGTLLVHEWSGGLLLLRTRKGRHLLNYYINDPAVLPGTSLPCDTVLEIPAKPSARAEACKAADYWTGFGFKPLFERVRLMRPAGITSPLITSGTEAGQAETGELDDVYALMQNCFDPLTGCLPEPEELRADIENGQVLCFKDSNGIFGLLRFSERTSSTEIRHLAVCEKYRGRGAAQGLLSAFNKRTCEKKCTVWVRDGYAPALRAYAAAGFTPDGWRATVYKYNLREC